MTLHVPIEDFAATVKRVLGHQEAFLHLLGRGTLATAGGKDMVVAARSKSNPDDVKKQLEALGMSIYRGSWLEYGLEELGMQPLYVGAVAYKSDDERPGLWLDAYEQPVTPIQVLRAMYEEFVQTGELHDVDFESFMRMANANVVVLSPEDLEKFAAINPQPTDTSV